MHIKKILIMLSLHLSLYSYGQEERALFESLDFVKFNFRLDKTELNNHYINNEQSIKHLGVLLNQVYKQDIDSIKILATASPEGDFKYNKILSEKRAKAIKDYIVSLYPYLSEYKIRTYGTGENWSGLNNYIQRDHNIPHREDIIKILTENKDPGSVEKQLRNINSGISWRYLNKNKFDSLRLGIATIYRNPTQRIE